MKRPGPALVIGCLAASAAAIAVLVFWKGWVEPVRRAEATLRSLEASGAIAACERLAREELGRADRPDLLETVGRYDAFRAPYAGLHTVAVLDAAGRQIATSSGGWGASSGWESREATLNVDHWHAATDAPRHRCAVYIRQLRDGAGRRMGYVVIAFQIR